MTGQFPKQREAQPEEVEVEEQQVDFGGAPPIFVEEIINTAMMTGGPVTLPDGSTLHLLQLITPNGHCYTVKLSEEGRQAVIRLLSVSASGLEIVQRPPIVLPR